MADESDDLHPPLPTRVAARSIVLSMVTCRGFIERDAGKADSFWKETLEWFKSLNLENEVEPWEDTVLNTPLGKLEQKDQVNAQWLCEGLAVLAWALGRAELPQHDAQVDPAGIANSLGFKASRSETVLNKPELRPAEELTAVRESFFSVHWRLRQFSLNPERVDFKAFAEKAWFGPLSLEHVRLAQNDLAIGKDPIWKAPPDKVRTAMSIAQERHRAANWLIGESELFSQTETNT